MSAALLACDVPTEPPRVEGARAEPPRDCPVVVARFGESPERPLTGRLVPGEPGCGLGTRNKAQDVEANVVLIKVLRGCDPAAARGRHEAATDRPDSDLKVATVFDHLLEQAGYRRCPVVVVGIDGIKGGIARIHADAAGTVFGAAVLDPAPGVASRTLEFWSARD